MATITDAQIRDAFTLFDVKGGGRLSLREMSYAVKALGFAEFSPAYCRSLLEEFDVPIETPDDDEDEISKHDDTSRSNDLDSLIDHHFVEAVDFERIMSAKAPRWDSDEELLKVFQLMDIDHSNKISFEDLKQSIRLVGEDIKDDTIERMIAEADVLDRDGQVDFKEFKKILLASDVSTAEITTLEDEEEY